MIVWNCCIPHQPSFWTITRNYIHDIRWLLEYIIWFNWYMISNLRFEWLLSLFIVNFSLSHLYNDLYRQPIPRRHQNGEMLEYVIRAEANNTQYDDVRMTFSLDKPDAALIRDINPHSSYNLSVRGRNAAGWSPHNDMAILATDNGESCRNHVTLSCNMILQFKLALRY